MLKKRLIPKLQLKHHVGEHGSRSVLVTTVNFGRCIEIGDPVSQARIYQAQAADELIFLDLDARDQGRSSLLETVRLAARELFMPFTVGGGVGSLQDFRMLLENGADKVGVNTAAIDNPALISHAADLFGTQCVVVSIDYRRDANNDCYVWKSGGRERTGLRLVEWAQEVEARGAGELLLTSIDRDGTRSGLDIEATQAVSSAVRIPVITAGGCGLASHFVQGFADGGADAVSAGTFFCFRDQNPLQTRAHISNSGAPIRMHV